MSYAAEEGHFGSALDCKLTRLLGFYRKWLTAVNWPLYKPKVVSFDDLMSDGEVEAMNSEVPNRTNDELLLVKARGSKNLLSSETCKRMIVTRQVLFKA